MLKNKSTNNKLFGLEIQRMLQKLNIQNSIRQLTHKIGKVTYQSVTLELMVLLNSEVYYIFQRELHSICGKHKRSKLVLN